MTCAQAKAERRKAKYDPRYRAWRKDPNAKAKRQAEQLADERRRLENRKKSK